MSSGQWAFWVAAAAGAATGKFLDDYHIRNDSKSDMRELLIRWFLWVDERSVPDLGGAVLKGFTRRRLPLAVGIVLLSYPAAITALYLGRQIFGPPVDQTYLTYVLTWIPPDDTWRYWLAFMVGIITPGLVWTLAMAYCFHRASVAVRDLARLSLITAGTILGLVLALSGLVVVFVATHAGGYFVGTFLLAGLASVVPPALLAAATMALIFLRLSLALVRSLLLELFDVASAPSTSPFTYTASLIGVAVLIFKVAQTALSSD